jgi:hypothetical protein
MAEPKKDQQREIVDARTGAIVEVRGINTLTPPDMKSVSRIDKVAGKNPAAANLRDHPEFSGMELVAVDAKFGSGEISGRSTAFVVIAGFLFKPGDKPSAENAVTLITGADNVYARLAMAYSTDSFPIAGTLRKSGKAWFID